MFTKPKIIAAMVAAALAALGVIYPELATPAATIAGILLGKEYLPASGSR